MIGRIRILGFVVLLGWAFCAFGLPKNIRKKVDKEIARTFEVTDFNLEPVTVPASLAAGLPAPVDADHLFRIERAGELLGYAYASQAPSKTAEFDYLVLFGPDLKIAQARVLIYREEYGGEIGSNRWLRQFEGKGTNDRLSPDTNIDAISGATISVRSMTRAVDELLQSLQVLQQNSVL